MARTMPTTTMNFPRFAGSRYSISIVREPPSPGPARAGARRSEVMDVPCPFRLVPGHQPRHLTAEQSGIAGIRDHGGDRIPGDCVRVHRRDAHDGEADDVHVFARRRAADGNVDRDLEEVSD